MSLSDPMLEKRVRELVTPEGVDLRVVLADASERFGAFALDIVFIVVALIVLSIAAFLMAMATGGTGVEFIATIWILGFFALRVFYFTFFEMQPRAATPGKRIMGLRVAKRDGSALTADAIFVRNAMRELEIFLPLTFLFVGGEAVDGWIALFALLWCGVFAFFPLFNRDRLRIGDIVAGTWVVHVPKRVLAGDLAAQPPSLAFTREALDAYGIRELSVLEDVLRQKDPQTMEAVARRIRHKIGSQDGLRDVEFLQAYYTALRGRLEQRMLFGKRKRDKHDKS
ncbi:MAG TPA: RDD family protein [Rhizomicrobium sp.]|jgi:uncharacterized RDD family membrane protein YckC